VTVDGPRTGSRQLLNVLKAHAAPREPALSLAVGRPVEALLRPVATREGRLNPQDVSALTAWRNRFVHSFLTEFEANEARTSRWLTQAIDPDDTRILFMVDDAHDGRPIGYMGVAFIDWERGSGEADAVVRGGDAPPGLMTLALRTMLTWARDHLELVEIGVRVRSDNTAMIFYRKFGFQEVKRVPLRRIETHDMVRWIEDESLQSAEASLVHMALPADRLER